MVNLADSLSITLHQKTLLGNLILLNWNLWETYDTVYCIKQKHISLSFGLRLVERNKVYRMSDEKNYWLITFTGIT
jgi:hypothetical protein